MKALILNSGLGRRMGVLTSEHPKCMTEISPQDTILSRQLRMLSACGVSEVVLTTGLFNEVLVNYCRSLRLPLRYTFVHNPQYERTNYIYSIYCAREALQDDDILLIHGDLVFSWQALEQVLAFDGSCVAVSSTVPLPEKDFKAVLRDGCVRSIGIEFFTDAVASQPLYKLQKADWQQWLASICRFCEAGDTRVYAENAFNAVSDRLCLRPLDVQDDLCNEIDTPQDLAVVSSRLAALENRVVYMCFSADIIHSGHIAIIERARRYGRLVVGVLSDEAIAGYKRFPAVPVEERRRVMESIAGVSQVIVQPTLSYRTVLEELRPAYVAHGDDWRQGVQRPIRDEVLQVLAGYGGQLLEFPYGSDARYRAIEREAERRLSLPDVRCGRLRRQLQGALPLTVLGVHDAWSARVGETASAYRQGFVRQFDALWVAPEAMPALDGILAATVKPLLVDLGPCLATGLARSVQTLCRKGVSAAVIGTEEPADAEQLGRLLRAAREGAEGSEMLLFVRLSAANGQLAALARACLDTGADDLLIDGRGDALLSALHTLREQAPGALLAAAVTEGLTEEDLIAAGARLTVYPDQLLHSAVGAMQACAEKLLSDRAARKADK